MFNKTDFFNDPDTLFGKLRSACSEEWNAYCSHDFVKQISDGILPKPCFRHYLLQDYLFLIHFSRAWALAVYKSDTLEDMRAAAANLDAHLNYETKLHIKFCGKWGISEEEMKNTAEARANMAYTRYVLERGMAGGILDLHVALSPCIVGYAVIGKAIMEGSASRLENNPYREWIEMYADQEYQDVALNAAAHLDKLALVHMGPGRFDHLVKTFRQSTSLEIGFWDMGLNLSD